jgi:hypothetical protein
MRLTIQRLDAICICSKIIRVPRTGDVAERLIEAYRLNQQPELADEMQKNS